MCSKFKIWLFPCNLEKYNTIVILAYNLMLLIIHRDKRNESQLFISQYNTNVKELYIFYTNNEYGNYEKNLSYVTKENNTTLYKIVFDSFK